MQPREQVEARENLFDQESMKNRLIEQKTSELTIENRENGKEIGYLEALLSDLQHTTEVLRRANLGDRYSQSREDLEPVYQEQTRREQTR